MHEDPANALASYFESMLKDVDSEAESGNSPEYASASLTIQIDEQNSQTHFSKKTSVNCADISGHSIPLVIKTQTLPDWARSSFEVLLVRLHHVKIAVPLLQIGMVCKIETHLVNLANTPSWFMGLYPQKGINTKVLDTDLLLNTVNLSSGKTVDYRYFLTLAGSQYALACCQIEKVIRLTPDGVRWRTMNDNSLWNRGILPTQMCVLIDTCALLEQWLVDC